MTKFESIIKEVKMALVASQGGPVRVDFDGGFVTAFRAGGNVRPDAFRSTWRVGVAKMTKDAARYALK